MLGNHVFLFPDYGDAFLRSLKANALYARQVTSSVLLLTAESEAWASSLVERAKGATPPDSIPDNIRRPLSYLEFVLRAQPTVRPLCQAGILRAPYLNSVQSALVNLKNTILTGQSECGAETVQAMDRLKAGDPGLIDLIRQARRERCPSLLDLLPVLVAMQPGDKPTLDDFDPRKYPLEVGFTLLLLQECVQGTMIVPMFGFVLASAAAAFESSGVPVVWSQPIFRDGVWAAQRILSSSSCDPQGVQRADAEGVLGTTIVETYLPAVHDLPVEEILDFRTKHEAELNAFRSGVSELCTSIDVTQPARDIERQSRDLVRAKVEPAVRDLRARLKIARLEALQKIGQSWQSLAGPTFSASIAVLAGAPLDVTPFVLLAGAFGQALFAGEIESRKIRHSSQWSALLRFDELSN